MVFYCLCSGLLFLLSEVLLPQWIDWMWVTFSIRSSGVFVWSIAVDDPTHYVMFISGVQFGELKFQWDVSGV